MKRLFIIFTIFVIGCSKKNDFVDVVITPTPTQSTEQPNIPKGYYVGKTSYELEKAVKFYNIDSIKLKFGLMGLNDLKNQQCPVYVDLNNDGFEDIYFPNKVNGNYQIRPTTLTYKNRFFNIDSSMLDPNWNGTSVTRKILVGDFNNDSLPDLFLINHGFEALTDIGVGTFYYEYCGVLLSQKNGPYQYKQLTEFGKKFWHGGASGDLNGDGNLDVIICEGTTTILLGDGKGGFIKSNIQLNVGNSNGYVTAEIVDVDKDGKNDIILSGDEGQPLPAFYSESSIFFNKGNSFEKVIITTPNTNGWRSVMDIACEDIDNDGVNEIFLIRTEDNTAEKYGGYWFGGYWITVYKKDNLGTYKDVTNDFIPDNQLKRNKTGQWMYQMVMKKETDGLFGIYAYITDVSTVQYWKQNSNKVFVKVR